MRQKEITLENFWTFVDKSGGEDACWPWKRAKRNKYGVMRLNCKVAYTHRIAAQLANGAAVGDLFVLHICDNPPCCNPKHLVIGTRQENVDDMVRKKRHSFGDRHSSRLHPERVARGDRSGSRRHPEKLRRGESHPSSKLTEEAVREIHALRAIGLSQQKIATRFGVARENVRGILHGRIWKHVLLPIT